MTRRPSSPLSGRLARGNASSGVAVDPSVYGVNGFTTLNHYITANPGGLYGSASGAVMACLFTVTSQAVSGAVPRTLSSSWYSNSGHFLRTTGSNVGLQYVMQYGVAAPLYTITAGDVGKVMMGVGVMPNPAPAGTIRLYVARAEVGSGTAWPGGGATTPNVTSMGIRGDLTSPVVDGVDIHGFAEFTGTPSLAQVQTYFDDVKSLADIHDTLGGCTLTNLWSIKRDQTGSAPTTLNDYGPAGDDMTLSAGSLTLTTNATPAWHW